MKGPSDFENIFIHRENVDMRRGINGLSEIVQSAKMGEVSLAEEIVGESRETHARAVLVAP